MYFFKPVIVLALAILPCLSARSVLPDEMQRRFARPAASDACRHIVRATVKDGRVMPFAGLPAVTIAAQGESVKAGSTLPEKDLNAGPAAFPCHALVPVSGRPGRWTVQVYLPEVVIRPQDEVKTVAAGSCARQPFTWFPGGALPGWLSKVLQVFAVI
jgi:hypothetical protein